MSLNYEWKASEHPLQIKYLLVFFVEEPATWLVLRKLVGAPDQMDFGEEHVASFLVLFSFCRQNHILPKLCPHFLRFCFLSP